MPRVFQQPHCSRAPLVPPLRANLSQLQPFVLIPLQLTPLLLLKPPDSASASRDAMIKSSTVAPFDVYLSELLLLL